MNNDIVLLKAEESLKPTITQLIQDQSLYDPSQDNKYLEEGTFLLSKFSNAKKEIEDLRVSFTKPLNESLKKINSFFKSMSDPIETADRELRKKLVIYRQQVEAENKAKRLEEFKSGVEVEQLTPAIKSKIGGVVTRKVWTFKVMDLTMVPTDYLGVDSVKVREAIKQGTRTIPGLDIYQEKQISL